MQEYLGAVVKRKDLLVYLVISGLKAQHRNSFLGYLWWLLDPLLNIAIYYFLVVILWERGGPDYGGFLVVGMVAWRWVKTAVNASSTAIISQSSIISKVYLPKVIFPLSIAFTQLINFFFGLIIVVIYLIISRTVPGIEIVWLPFVIFIQFLFLLALSMILGYVCVFIRDVDNAISHLMRIWFYASPIIWERGRLPVRYQWVVDLNPISAILKSYRNIILNTGGPEFEKLLLMGLVSIAIIVFMVYYYSLNEHKIIKVL